MCAVKGCSNVPTRKVTLAANTVFGDSQETIEMCEEHWSALNGRGAPCSMGCAPTESSRNSEHVSQQT